MGAAFLITGEVRKVGASFLGDVKLHDTEKGTLLAVQSFQAGDEVGMVGQTTGATETMLARRGRSRGPEPPAWCSPPPSTTSRSSASAGRSVRF